MVEQKETVQNLKPISAATLALFDSVCKEVEDDVLLHCMAEDSPLEYMGEQAESLIRTGLGFVTRMLRAAMQFAAEGILNDELDWGKTRLPVQGVSASMVFKNFDRYTRALKSHVSPEVFGEIEPYLRLLLEKQQQIVLAKTT